MAVGSGTVASHSQSAQLSEHILITGLIYKLIKKATTSSSPPAPPYERAKSAITQSQV